MPRHGDGNAPTQDAIARGGAAWIDPELQQQVEWRDGDIIVSVPAKSGTTWMMNIVHQLRTGGEPGFKDIYIEVPWLEFVEGPEDNRERRLERFRSMTRSRRRAFKTHSAPPPIPYIEPGSGAPDVRSVVVVHNPEEALVSLKPFIEGHSQAFFDHWKVPKDSMTRPAFADFYREVLANMPIAEMFFGSVASWVAAPEQAQRARASLLGAQKQARTGDPGPCRFPGFFADERRVAANPRILFVPSMKRFQDKFELQHLLGFPVLGDAA